MMENKKESDFGLIPSSWEVGTFGEICEFVTDGAHLSPKQKKTSYFMASVKDMEYDRFDFSNCKTISKEDFEYLEHNNCSPNHGDILLSKDGANCLDIIFVYKQPDKIVLLSSIAIARLKKNYSPDFYRYFLLSPNIQYLMRNNFVSGSAIPRVILKDFKNVPVPIISFSQQISIASILNSLDDKINLLLCQNKTLEDMTDTLFRQWFLEEKEDIWKEGVLSDLIEVKYGKDHKKLNEGNIPVFGSGGIMRYVDKALYTEESVLIPRKGSLNNVIYINEDFWTVDTMFYTKMKRKNIAKFIYHFVKEKDLAAMNVGSAVPSMTTKVLNSMPIHIPSEEKLKQFEESCAIFYKRMKFNKNQIKTLENQRDTLLPKLMNGTIKINE